MFFIIGYINLWPTYAIIFRTILWIFIRVFNFKCFYMPGQLRELTSLLAKPQNTCKLEYNLCFLDVSKLSNVSVYDELLLMQWSLDTANTWFKKNQCVTLEICPYYPKLIGYSGKATLICVSNTKISLTSQNATSPNEKLLAISYLAGVRFKPRFCTIQKRNC